MEGYFQQMIYNTTTATKKAEDEDNRGEETITLLSHRRATSYKKSIMGAHSQLSTQTLPSSAPLLFSAYRPDSASTHASIRSHSLWKTIPNCTPNTHTHIHIQHHSQPTQPSPPYTVLSSHTDSIAVETDLTACIDGIDGYSLLCIPEAYTPIGCAAAGGQQSMLQQQRSSRAETTQEHSRELR